MKMEIVNNMGTTIIMLILDTGEYMMGVQISNDENGVVLDKPVAVQVREDGQGLMFMPYLQLVEETQCLYKPHHVRHVLSPKEALVDNYRKQFLDDVGLMVPDQNIIS